MFALQFTAARAEWNRQCRRAQGLPAATSPAPRWKAVLKDWKWRLDDGLWHSLLDFETWVDVFEKLCKRPLSIMARWFVD